MSYRGINPNNGTVQIYDSVGNRWVSYNSLSFSEAGSNATLTAAGNLTLNGLSDVSVVATAGTLTGSGQTGVAWTATTGSIQLNATDAAGDIVGTAGNDISLQAAGDATLVSTGGFLTANGATGIGMTSASGDVDITSTTGFANFSGDNAVAVTSVSNAVNINAATTLTAQAAGNATLVSTGGFLTANGDTGIGMTSANGDVDITSTTGFANFSGDSAVAVTSVSSGVNLNAVDTSIAMSASAGVIDVTAAQTNFSGNVTVAGSSMAVDSQITLADRFIDINVGMTTPGAVTSGMDTNSNAVGPSTAVAGGAFVSATRVEVADTTGLAANDVIEVADAANASNRGRFAIDTVVSGTEIDIKAVPNNAPILQTTFVADSTVQGTVTKITVDAWRFSGTGTIESTFGNTTDAAWTWTGLSGVTTLDTTAGGLTNAVTITPTVAVGGAVTVDLPNIELTTDKTRIGSGTPAASTLGINTVVLGSDAALLATGANNTLIGHDAAPTLTTGQDNTIVGYQITTLAPTGSGATAVGSTIQVGDGGVVFGALSSSGTGANSVVVGRQSGGSGNSAGSNTLIGTQVMPFGSGGDNTMVGFNTGFFMASGGQNVVAGSTAANAALAIDDSVVVGHNAAGTATALTDAIIVGQDAISALAQSITGTVIVGSGALAAIAPAFGLTGGVYIGRDVAATGTKGLATGDVIIGDGAAAAYGTLAAPGITPDGNVIIGGLAGLGLDGTGVGNVFLGHLSGANTVTGGGNIVLGRSVTVSNGTAGGASSSGQILMGSQLTGVAGADNIFLGSSGPYAQATDDIDFLVTIRNHSAARNGAAAFGMSNAANAAQAALLTTQATGFADVIPLGTYREDDDDAVFVMDTTQDATNGGTVKFFAGNRNPNGVVTGVEGDLYFRADGTNSVVYQRRTAGSGTVWATTGGGTETLQESYDAGNTIVTSGGSGNLDISGTESLIANMGAAVTLTGGTGLSATAATGTLTLAATAANVDIDGASGVNIDATGVGANVIIQSASAAASLQGATAGVTATTGTLTLAATAANVDIDGAAGVNIDATGVGANVIIQSASAAASLQGATAGVTATTGTLTLAASAANVDIDGASGVTINATGVGANVIIASATAAAALSGVNASVSVSTVLSVDDGGGTGAADEVLTADGAGNASWQPAPSSSAAKTVSEISADPAPSAAILEANQITYACDVNGGAFTVTLPDTGSEPAAGTVVVIKDANNGGTQAGTNNITIDAQSSDIDGQTTQTIAIDYAGLTIQSRGPGNGYMII
jgi:hypothetical protein